MDEKKKKINFDHIRWSGVGHFLCEYCGDKYEMQMPVSIEVIIGAMKGYIKNHKNCKPKQTKF